MKHAAKTLGAVALAINAFAASDAFASKYLAGTYNTLGYLSTSTSDVQVPVATGGGTALAFTTTKTQRVKITYNAECAVKAERGRWLNVRILVDDIETNPASGTDFALCSAVEPSEYRFASGVRQSIITVPAGAHTVRIKARLMGGAGTWWLDDSSLVVEGAPLAAATRTYLFLNLSDADELKLPLKNNGATKLQFTTTKDNQSVLVTYNAECVARDIINARSLEVLSLIDGVAPPENDVKLLCASFDISAKTWVGAATQKVFKVPTKGDHAARVNAYDQVSAWAVDDSSLVVDMPILASAWRNAQLQSSSTSEIVVPLDESGGEVLKFKTTAASQTVVITYSAACAINAQLGTQVRIRVAVDDAPPVANDDFVLCSAWSSGANSLQAGFRQTIRLVGSGEHVVRIYAKASAAASWNLRESWLVVR
jgi:hypothetical protein